jgi:hypothetical protein
MGKSDTLGSPTSSYIPVLVQQNLVNFGLR